jgi:hypothetical protein
MIYTTRHGSTRNIVHQADVDRDTSQALLPRKSIDIRMPYPTSSYVQLNEHSAAADTGTNRDRLLAAVSRL